MSPLHASQIKAARAILDWSQDDLANATGLAVTTIRNLETGYIPRGKTAQAIRHAIENAGLEFIEPQGIRRRIDEIVVYEGSDSCDVLFDDIIRTVRKQGGDVLSIMLSQRMMIQSCGAAENNGLKPLLRLNDFADVKCLVPDTERPAAQLAEIEFRTVAKESIGPMPFYVYGDKHALVLQESSERFRFVVFNSPSIAHTYRAHFLTLWEMAMPLAIIAKKQAHRARA